MPLTEVATVTFGKGPNQITRQNKERYVEIDGDVLVAQRHQRQPAEDQRRQQHLGDFEGAENGQREEVTADHVGAGERHHGEQHRGGERAEHRHHGAIEQSERLRPEVHAPPGATFPATFRPNGTPRP